MKNQKTKMGAILGSMQFGEGMWAVKEGGMRTNKGCKLQNRFSALDREEMYLGRIAVISKEETPALVESDDEHPFENWKTVKGKKTLRMGSGNGGCMGCKHNGCRGF